MQMEMKFIVVPFVGRKKGQVSIGEMRQSSSSAAAERLADNMAARFAGVAAYSVMVDKDSGDMTSPQLLRKHGVTLDLMAEA